MPLKDPTLQNLLQQAQAELSRVEATLDGQVPKKSPKWRRANSRVKQIEGRLSSRSSIATAHAAPEAGSDE